MRVLEAGAVRLAEHRSEEGAIMSALAKRLDAERQAWSPQRASEAVRGTEGKARQ